MEVAQERYGLANYGVELFELFEVWEFGFFCFLRQWARRTLSVMSSSVSVDTGAGFSLPLTYGPGGSSTQPSPSRMYMLRLSSFDSPFLTASWAFCIRWKMSVTWSSEHSSPPLRTRTPCPY